MQDHNILDLNEPDEPVRTKAFTLPLQIAVATILAGTAFKLQHWPAAHIILMTGFAGILFLYPLRYLKKQEKKALDHLKLVLVIAWTLNGLFVTFHLPYKYIFQLLSGIACLAWIILESIDYFRGSGQSNTPAAFASPLFAAAAMFTLAGAMMKVQHWPFSGLLMICGIAIGIFWVFKELFRK